MSKGAVWMVLFKLTARGLGLISTIILARLLMPSDFGLIAMAMSIIAALELLSAFSFDMALIQNQQAERCHYDTAWTFNVLFAVTSAVILLLLAGPAARFYDQPQLDTVMYFLAIGALVQGFENIGVVAFRKEMEFHREFKFLLSKKLVAFSVTVPLAFLLRNYWALVAGMLAGKIAGVVISYLAHSYRPRFCLKARAELFHFSKWLMVSNALIFLRIRSADFIIGKVSGSHALGLYTIAYEISNLPTTELIAPINRAVFPGYAKMSSELAELRQGFLSVISVIAMFALPAAAGIVVTAELLVRVFLGTNWLEAVPLMQILAVFGAIIAMQTNTGYVYLALGQPRILTLLGGAYILVLIPTLIWLVPDNGALGAAWAYLITAITLLPVYYFALQRRLQLKSTKLLSVVWRPVAATLAMSFATQTVLALPLFGDGLSAQILQLAVTVISGVISYALVLFGLWRLSGAPDGAEQFIFNRLRNILKPILPVVDSK